MAQQQRLNELRTQLIRLQDAAAQAQAENRPLPLPTQHERELAGQLWDIENEACAADRMRLAAQAVALAEGLAQLYPSDNHIQAIVKLLSEHHDGTRQQRFQWPAQRALLGGDPPLIRRIGEGPAVAFRVAPAAQLLPWANKIIELAREWLGQGRTIDTIRLIDAVLSAIPPERHPRLHHRLLKALAGALTDPANTVDLKGCQGIGNAILTMAGAWWDPTPKPSYYLSLQHRQALLARCDWRVVAEVLGQDVDRQLRQNASEWRGHPAGTLDALDLTLLMDDMDRLLRGAEEHQDRPRLQDLLRQTRDLIGQTRAPEPGTPAAIAPAVSTQALLQDRCACLVRRCERALQHTRTIPVNQRLALEVSRDRPSGEWTLRPHAPADKPALDPAQDEQAAFIASIHGLLEDPEGPPWRLLNEAITQACEATGWDAKDMPWLQWCLLEAGRRGTGERQTRPLEQHLAQPEPPLDGQPPNSRGTTDDRIFDALVHLVRQQWPWRSVQRAIEAVQRARGWQPSPSQQCSLGLELARRGEPQVLADLLQQGGLEDQLSQPQRLKLLEIGDLPLLSVEARAQLLRLASPLFPEGSLLRSSYETLRTQHETQLPRRPIGSSRTPLQASPQRPTLTSPRGPVGSSHAPRPTPPHVQIQQAREALKPWFGIDTQRTPQPIAEVSRFTAPRTHEERHTFETALFHWMDLELRHRTLSGADLRDLIDDIETRWRWTIDRDRLRELFEKHAKHSNDPNLLRELLPWLMAG